MLKNDNDLKRNTCNGRLIVGKESIKLVMVRSVKFEEMELKDV